MGVRGTIVSVWQHHQLQLDVCLVRGHLEDLLPTGNFSRFSWPNLGWEKSNLHSIQTYDRMIVCVRIGFIIYSDRIKSNPIQLSWSLHLHPIYFSNQIRLDTELYGHQYTIPTRATLAK